MGIIEKTQNIGPLISAAVLLAAGLSSRMWPRNKLLIEIQGEPMVRRTARTYLAVCNNVHAVVGYEADRVREALKDLPLTIVENARFAEGQASSVRMGLESLSGRYDAVLMALADQAMLTPADIAGLLHAFCLSSRDRILIPHHRGARGNPAVFPPNIIQDIIAAGPGADCRRFIDANPQRTVRYNAANNHFVTDFDTPDDLRVLEMRSSSLQSRRRTHP